MYTTSGLGLVPGPENNWGGFGPPPSPGCILDRDGNTIGFKGWLQASPNSPGGWAPCRASALKPLIPKPGEPTEPEVGGCGVTTTERVFFSTAELSVVFPWGLIVAIAVITGATIVYRYMR